MPYYLYSIGNCMCLIYVFSAYCPYYHYSIGSCICLNICSLCLLPLLTYFLSCICLCTCSYSLILHVLPLFHWLCNHAYMFLVLITFITLTPLAVYTCLYVPSSCFHYIPMAVYACECICSQCLLPLLPLFPWLYIDHIYKWNTVN